MSIAERALFGALAGTFATLLMTAAMRRMHQRLRVDEAYPLPPREIAEHLPSPGMSVAAATVAYHFAYGGAMGALYPVVTRRRDLKSGIGFGLATWAASYLGWIPMVGILKPAIDHPIPRNALMMAAHVVWGCCLA